MDNNEQPRDIYREAVTRIDGGRPFAMAIVLDTEGSTPQRTGVRAVIDEAGQICGTLGGGPVEAEAQRRAVEVCQSGRAAVIAIDLHDAYSRDARGICGGRMRILLDPTAPKDRACYAQAAETLERHERGVLLTTIRTGYPAVRYPAVRGRTLGRTLDVTDVTVQWHAAEAVPEIVGFPGAEAIQSCVDRESAQLLAADAQDPEASVEVLIEPVIPKPNLLIVGGGHVGQALARQAVPLGFDVTVIDDRPEFTQPALFPDGVATRCGDVPREVAAFAMADAVTDAFIVLVTRGHKHDAEALEACIHAPAAYVGMIGSRRKVAMMRRHFIESGLATEDEFDGVHAPIGLDIGAVTVPEIATSIAAQLVAVRRQSPAHASRGATGSP